MFCLLQSDTGGGVLHLLSRSWSHHHQIWQKKKGTQDGDSTKTNKSNKREGNYQSAITDHQSHLDHVEQKHSPTWSSIQEEGVGGGQQRACPTCQIGQDGHAFRNIRIITFHLVFVCVPISLSIMTHSHPGVTRPLLVQQFNHHVQNYHWITIAVMFYLKISLRFSSWR